MGAGICGALIVAAVGGGALAAPVETVLHSFTGGPSDGSEPHAGLIADGSGNLYGTTFAGRRRRVEVWHGIQALAERDRDGAARLYAFRQRREWSQSRPDCRRQRQSLRHDGIWRSVGKRRGVQALAGRDRDGALLLYGSDGAFPSGLIADSSGNLYGTALGGASG